MPIAYIILRASGLWKRLVKFIYQGQQATVRLVHGHLGTVSRVTGGNGRPVGCGFVRAIEASESFGGYLCHTPRPSMRLDIHLFYIPHLYIYISIYDPNVSNYTWVLWVLMIYGSSRSEVMGCMGAVWVYISRCDVGKDDLLLRYPTSLLPLAYLSSGGPTKSFS